MHGGWVVARSRFGAPAVPGPLNSAVTSSERRLGAWLWVACCASIHSTSALGVWPAQDFVGEAAEAHLQSWFGAECGSARADGRAPRRLRREDGSRFACRRLTPYRRLKTDFRDPDPSREAGGVGVLSVEDWAE